MGSGVNDASSGGECECKVGRITEQYDLDGLDGDLRHERRDGQTSLRELATLVNARILKSTIDQTDADIAGDPESILTALEDDAVDLERRKSVRDQLAYTGIDIDELESSFVSHQTVKKHLNSCMDVDTSRSGIETIAEGTDVIEWAQTRNEEIIQRTINRLQRIGELPEGDLRLSRTVTLTCEECDSSYRLQEYLERGGCDC